MRGFRLPAGAGQHEHRSRVQALMQRLVGRGGAFGRDQIGQVRPELTQRCLDLLGPVCSGGYRDVQLFGHLVMIVCGYAEHVGDH